jgi:hypothetical protein
MKIDPYSRPFRYKVMWAKALDYKEVVEKSWSEGFEGPRNIQSVWSNLGKMACSLQQWSKE